MLQILPTYLLDAYRSKFDNSIKDCFLQLKDSDLSIDDFSFYTSVSAVFSSKIEGESIDLDEFIKHKNLQAKYNPNYTKKIEDLYSAYIFAQKNKITPVNIAKAHALLTKNILQKHQQGSFRNNNMFVIADDGKIEYVAASPYIVTDEMEKLYADLNILLKQEMDIDQVLFFASMLHLILVKIHPFSDGNGRTARLLEKWFIGEKLGEKAWFVPSEKFYYNNHQLYYNTIRELGLEYEELDYTQAMPFLELLPQSINQ